MYPSLPPALPELLAHMPDGLIVLDRSGIVVLHNDIAMHLLGTLLHDWDGQHFLDVLAGSTLQFSLGALLAPPIAATTRQFKYRCADDLRVIECQLCPIADGDTAGGLLLVLRDRTEQAQLENLREQKLRRLSRFKRFARIANASHTAADLVGGIVGELVLAFPKTRAVAGVLQTGGTLRLIFDDRLHATSEASVEVAENAWLEHIRHAERPFFAAVDAPWLAETPLQAGLRQAGMRKILVAPLVHSSKALGMLCVGYADDRTFEQLELQLFGSIGELTAEALNRVRATEEAIQAKSSMLATVSHELRTPLSSIVGFMELIEEGMFGLLPEQFLQPLSMMQASCLALQRQIDDLRDFVGMEANHFHIALEPVDLATVIREVVDTLQPQILKRGLAVRLAIAPALPQVHANGARLAQVLTNLLANALKFTEHGSITVRASADGERVRFSVTDTGIGIALQQQHKLFREFQQLDSDQARRYGGSGLGLAISQKLMERMGGTLIVESTPGIGSTFCGEVPIAHASVRPS
jgi:signal transduction histidine kinase